MDALRPVLFGLTTTPKIWPTLVPSVLVGWVPLWVAPRWKYTPKITLAVPFAHGILYSAIFLPIMFLTPPEERVDMNSMQDIFKLFQDFDIFFCGWVHYLCFDLLVARGLAQDALENCKVSNWKYYGLVLPCLFSCMYCGPVGYVMYMTLRGLGVIAPPDDGVEGGK